MFGNPIVEKEFRTHLRRFRTFGVRSGYVASLVLPLFLVGQNATALETREAFLILLWIQLGLIVFLAPVFTAGSLNTERRRRTLGTLLLTDLSVTEIVNGTFVPRAAYLVMVVLSALPVLILWIIFGSISWVEILVSQLIVLSVGILGTSVGLFWSACTERSLAALTGSYATLGALFGAGPVLGALFAVLGVEGLRPPTPPDVLSEMFSIEGALAAGSGAWGRWTLCAGLFLLPVFPFLRGASYFLDPFHYGRFRKRLETLVSRARAALQVSRRLLPGLEQSAPEGVFQPVAWRDLFASARFGLVSVVSGTAALLLLSLPLWFATWSFWENLWAHQIVLGSAFYLICFGATILASTSVAQEKETRTLDILLTAPIRPQAVLKGKMYALTLLFWIPLAVPLLHILFFTAAGRLSPATLLIFAAAAPTLVAFFTALGLFVSVAARSVLGAQTMGLIAMHACLLPGLLGIAVVPHPWFLLLPACPFPFAFQGVRPGPAALPGSALLPLGDFDPFLLFILALPGVAFTALLTGRILNVLKERFYSFVR